MKELLFVANLGSLVVTPLILCIYASIYIKNKYNLEDYVVVIGVFFGIFCGVYSFCKYIFKKTGGK